MPKTLLDVLDKKFSNWNDTSTFLKSQSPPNKPKKPSDINEKLDRIIKEMGK